MTTPLDATVGDQLPTITFGPISRATLALYAGASGDHNPIHIDSDMAKASGMTDVFAQGMLSFGVLARVPTEWAGADRLRSFGARFVSMTQVHDLVTCTGEVTECFEADGERRARVAVTATAQDGRRTLTGEAIIALD
ncbi:MaoC/PaaZ C-terminal domain-containing protein [Sphingomonas bacterium]|uniref:MaoC/PaaZ C-terminal domain-containing protein n=1 Tax=Sphingomonas bacterium TaxID=1895847 RepID=UPI00157506BE|nr:MaoC/PaaZ C-terminal domain-containing protein [Sphingomonas bacterium]